MQFLKTSSLMLSVAALCFAGCKKDTDTLLDVGTVDVTFENTVGNAPLDLTTARAAYKTAAGDSFRVTKLVYYISNVQFNKADGSSYKVPNSYFLVNQADAASQKISLPNIPVADYRSLTFVIGVDSTRNVSGAQTGALSQGNAMFWAWDTGYIFFKMEGNSPQARVGAAREGGLTFHVGGFRRDANAVRTVTTAVPNNGLIAVWAGGRPEVRMRADLLALFDGPTPLRFGPTGPPGTLQLTDVQRAGPNAVLVANNYARPAGGMFSIREVRGN